MTRSWGTYNMDDAAFEEYKRNLPRRDVSRFHNKPIFHVRNYKKNMAASKSFLTKFRIQILIVVLILVSCILIGVLWPRPVTVQGTRTSETTALVQSMNNDVDSPLIINFILNLNIKSASILDAEANIIVDTILINPSGKKNDLFTGDGKTTAVIRGKTNNRVNVNIGMRYTTKEDHDAKKDWTYRFLMRKCAKKVNAPVRTSHSYRNLESEYDDDITQHYGRNVNFRKRNYSYSRRKSLTPTIKISYKATLKFSASRQIIEGIAFISC